VSLSFAAAYAALLYSGPLAAIVVAIAASTNLAEIRSGKPLAIHLFNVGQLESLLGWPRLSTSGLGVLRSLVGRSVAYGHSSASGARASASI